MSDAKRNRQKRAEAMRKIPDDYPIRQRELLMASFALGQAQRDLEEAETRFKEALRNIERFEDKPWEPPGPKLGGAA